MANREQAFHMLYEKMDKELQSFRNSLLNLTPEDILSSWRPYELIYKEDLLLWFEEDYDLPLSDSDIEFLLDMDTPLDWLYKSWLDSSMSHMEMLREFITNTVKTTSQEAS